MTAPDAAIRVAGLRKSYGDVETVKGISFAVRAGTTTALLGGNGAGKTTTLSMLLGALTPTAGQVTVLGEDMLRHRGLAEAALRRPVGRTARDERAAHPDRRRRRAAGPVRWRGARPAAAGRQQGGAPLR